jgi:hypothetical protein
VVVDRERHPTRRSNRGRPCGRRQLAGSANVPLHAERHCGAAGAARRA